MYFFISVHRSCSVFDESNFQRKNYQHPCAVATLAIVNFDSRNVSLFSNNMQHGLLYTVCDESNNNV